MSNKKEIKMNNVWFNGFENRQKIDIEIKNEINKNRFQEPVKP